MGFGISGKQCVVCKKELPEAGNLYLVVEKGGFTCEECSRAGGLGTSFPGATRKLFASRTIDASYEHHPALSRTEEHRITRQIASYCQYHCDTRSELKALSFLETILFEGAAD
jgi:recombinational DNA repair protein (RecF pathway)